VTRRGRRLRRGASALLTLVAIATVWSASATASACTCGPPPLVLDAPADGAEGVPTNTLVWIEPRSIPTDASLDTFVLRSASAEIAVETSRIQVSFLEILVLDPLEDLEPETKHTVFACIDDACDLLVREFTTGPAADDSPPDVPVEIDRDWGAEGSDVGGGISCGKTRFVEVEVEFEGVLAIELGDVELDPASRSGLVEHLTTERESMLADNCIGNWPDDARDTTTVRYGAFDLAGNFSGFTEPDTIELRDGCGCTTDRRPGTTMLAVLFAMFARRRRR
jgi:MYXO-CTERM domain-containing protein